MRMPNRTHSPVFKAQGADGIHPSETGQQCVAGELLRYFATDTFAKRWLSQVEFRDSGHGAFAHAPDRAQIEANSPA